MSFPQPAVNTVEIFLVLTEHLCYSIERNYVLGECPFVGEGFLGCKKEFIR